MAPESRMNPETDGCETCAHLGRTCIERYNLHVQNKNLCRELKRTDGQVVKHASENLDLICFEFGAQLGSLWTFTLHSKLHNRAVCYLWEGEAGRDEACSCILDYLKTEVKQEPMNEFVMYCAPTPENSVVSSLIYAASKWGFKFTLRFLEKGHSQNEASSMNQIIFKRFCQQPTDWCSSFDVNKLRFVNANENNVLLSFNGLSKYLHVDTPFFWKAKEVVVDGSLSPLRMTCKSVSWQNPVMQERVINEDLSTYILPTK